MPNLIANNRTQLDFWGRSLENQISENHLARKIVNYASQFNRNKFDLRTAPGGKDQFDPLSLLALHLYCFTHSVYTSRKIEWAAGEWKGASYILAMEPIDHSTICRFIGKNSAVVCEIFYDFMDIIEAEGLVGPETTGVNPDEIIIDGTKVPASAGSHNSVKYGDYDKVVKKTKRKIRELNKECKEMLVTLHSLAKAPGESPEEFDNRVDGMRNEFVKKAERLRKNRKKITNLELAKANLEQEARDKAADDYRQEQEQQVLAKYRDEIESATNLLLDCRTAAAELEEEKKERLKAELPSRQAVRRELKSRKRETEKSHADANKNWQNLCKRIRADLNANCNGKLSPEELELRAKKLLSPNKQMNTTDFDSRSMRLANKSFDFAYNIQLGIDKKTKLAVGVRVTRDGNDLYQLRPMVRQIEENMGAVKKVDADCGYHVGHELSFLEVFGIDLWVPANHPESKRRGKLKKKKDTPQARRMERKRALSEYKRRAKERKQVEAEIGDTKFNDRFEFVYYRGIDKVTAVVTLKFLAHNMESYIIYKEKLQTEGKIDRTSLRKLEKAKFEKAVADFLLMQQKVLPRQQVLQFE